MSENMSPGAYDQLITQEISNRLQGLPAERVLREVLESDEAPQVLARHLQFLMRRAISSISNSDDPLAKIRMSNQIVNAIAALSNGVVGESDLISETGDPILWAIERESHSDSGFQTPSVRLSDSALLVNGRNQPSIGHELNMELTSADDVDLLCSFVLSTGIKILEKNLRSVVSRGGRVRVLTTTYMGATQKKALDRLVELGAEVRISYDGTTTRLHAKSWLLRRNSGATTAYVGSSNLSRAALTDGIEWNLKVSAREQSHIIDTVSLTFENYWNDIEFEAYTPDRDGRRLIAALEQAGKPSSGALNLIFANIEVSPRPYQQEVLDELVIRRENQDQWENLVVMATGTGKTIVAGLDFRRLFESGKVKSLLFIAHRKNILNQSLVTFRTIMRDGSFGQLLVDGNRPTNWTHVFGSVQSLQNLDSEQFKPDAFDMIIVDEFHHAAANTYEKLLSYYKPKVLLGLTATPERSDGQSILHWFRNGISAELRLWEAINRQILSPFQYFGINDNVDLAAAGVTWRRGQGYNPVELSNLFTGNDARVALILRQTDLHVDDLGTMKAIGFCVSIEHAEYMAKKFSEAGILSSSVTSADSSSDQEEILTKFRNGLIKVIFAVDIFNEGVDIPEVNTLLMLRPTESATVFIQQLGRGLRKSEKKNCLTVLDFVGNQNKNFRFDMKYGRLFGVGRRELADAVDNGFPYLPSGCHFELDRVTKEQVLNNLRSALSVNRKFLISEVRTIGDVSLSEFLESSDVTMPDLYRNEYCLTSIKGYAFEEKYQPTDLEIQIAKAMGRHLHVDDLARIDNYLEILKSPEMKIESPFFSMFCLAMFGKNLKSSDRVSRVSELKGSRISMELSEYFSILRQARSRKTFVDDELSLPLAIHARYTRAEATAAFGLEPSGQDQEGVRFAPTAKADIAFVTLNKTERHFSASTMYADVAISESIFQWESQTVTSESSAKGQRYIHHEEMGTTFHLFIREFKTIPENPAEAMPYIYLGPAKYISHSGSKPMRIHWKLKHSIPMDILSTAKFIAS